TALVTQCQVAAPLPPLVTEQVYTGLVPTSATAGGASVHLTDWPDAAAVPADSDLQARMAIVREACSALLSLRTAEHLRVRLPLPSATVAVPGPALVEPYAALIADELNAKTVELTSAGGRFGSKQLVLNPRALGPRLGGQVQAVIKAHKA